MSCHYQDCPYFHLLCCLLRIKTADLTYQSEVQVYLNFEDKISTHDNEPMLKCISGHLPLRFKSHSYALERRCIFRDEVVLSIPQEKMKKLLQWPLFHESGYSFIARKFVLIVCVALYAFFHAFHAFLLSSHTLINCHILRKV